MDEEGDEEQKLELQKRVQAFIDEQKSIIKLAKKNQMPTMAFNGYDVELNPKTGTYTVKFSRTNIAISQEDKKGNFSIYPDAIDEYNMLAKRAKEQGVETLDKPAGLIESYELRNFLEKQKERSNPGHAEKAPEILKSYKDQKKQEEPETKKDSENGQEEKGHAFKKLGQNAIIMNPNTKEGKMGVLAGILTKKYKEQLKGIELDHFAIAPDENDVNNFRLYAVSKNDEAVELPTKKLEGKNPGTLRDKRALIYTKDGGSVEAKQPMQMLMVDDSFGFGIFGEGTRYREATTLARTGGAAYYGHVIAKTGAEGEWQDASWDVRAGTDNTADQTIFEGDRQQKGYQGMADLKAKGTPDEINPASDGLDVHEVENVIQTKEKMKTAIMYCYGFSEESAQTMVDELTDPNSRKNFHEVYEETAKLDQEKSLRNGSSSVRESGGRTPGPIDPRGIWGE